MPSLFALSFVHFPSICFSSSPLCSGITEVCGVTPPARGELWAANDNPQVAIVRAVLPCVSARAAESTGDRATLLRLREMVNNDRLHHFPQALVFIKVCPPPMQRMANTATNHIGGVCVIYVADAVICVISMLFSANHRNVVINLQLAPKRRCPHQHGSEPEEIRRAVKPG